MVKLIIQLIKIYLKYDQNVFIYDILYSINLLLYPIMLQIQVRKSYLKTRLHEQESDHQTLLFALL